MAQTEIKTAMLNGIRQSIVDMVDHGRYKMGGTWYTSPIDAKGIQENGSVYAAFYVHRQGSAASATQFQVRNASGTVLASRTETIPFTDTTGTIMYRFKFGVSVASGGGS